MLEQKSLQQVAIDFVVSRSDSSFTKLYNRLKPGLRKFILKYHKDPEVVDEILAITLSKAYVYVDRYDSQWNFSTWIYKICQNECLMEIRRQNSLVSLNTMINSKANIKAVRDSDWKHDTDYEFFQNEELVQPDMLYGEILDEIRNLPEHYRDIISDRVVDKMKYKDIAEKRNLKINTVRSRIHSAKKVIKNLWIDKKKKTGGNKSINIVGVTILQLLDEPNIAAVLEKIPESSHIEIISAKYGSDTHCINVTDTAIKLFNSCQEIYASNKLGGDPCYGVKKKLFIEYSINGKHSTIEIKEGKSFNPRTKL